MRTVQDILQFHFSSAELEQSAQRIIPHTLNALNDRRIGRLQKTIDKIGASSFTFSGNNLIPHVFRKFKTTSKTKLRFDRRELRTLTYSLGHSEQDKESIFSNENELKFALSLLDADWRDSFLVGLIDCFLRNWETQNRKSLELLDQFIKLKLDSYTGSRSTLLSFKNNKRFFNISNGDLILGDTISKLNRSICDATKILGVPESWLAYPYFSKVIVTYYDKTKEYIHGIIDSLNEILDVHIHLKTKQRLIPKIVLQASEPKYATIKDKAKTIALAHLKDPQNKGESLWEITQDDTAIEVSILLKAKEVLLQWMAEEFIDFFFKECINDSRRRNFWLKYSNQISLFKIVGSAAIKALLLYNQRVNRFVEPRFASTTSQRDRNSALMFVIKGYLFVEFSDHGAFYAYKLTNRNAPLIESKFFSQTSDLKIPSMNWLAYRSGYYIQQTNEEGKLGHTDGDLTWEEVATYWLKNIAGINV